MTFMLHHQEQVYYTLRDLSATNPAGPVTVPVDGWPMSFDEGVTWHQSQAHPDLPAAPCWLVRGPGYSGDDVSGILITEWETVPLIRLSDTPETTIVQADTILLWR